MNSVHRIFSIWRWHFVWNASSFLCRQWYCPGLCTI